jgi:hypothetical protein
MGLSDILTQPIKLGSSAERWQEPMLFRIRLRGDFIWRLMFLLSAWGLATGVMLLVLAFNKNATSIPLAVGLGAVFGLGPAFLLLFMRRKHVSGTIWLYDDHIRMRHQYLGFPLLVVRWTEWDYAAIPHCMISTAEQLGQRFHVLSTMVEGRHEIVGIPMSIDLNHLVQFFGQRRVSVTAAASLPPQLRSGLHPVIALAVFGVALAALLAGLATYLTLKGV